MARSGFSEDQSSYLSRGQACRERGDTKDVTERWVSSHVLYSELYCTVLYCTVLY